MSSDLPEYPFPQPTALEPPPEWAELRAKCPVAEVRLASGDPALVLTRYQDVRQVLSDPRFTRQLDADGAARVTANESGGVFGAEQSDLPAAGDGHQRWRRLVGRYFTAKRMAAMQPRIAAMADQLVDGMVAGGGPADLVSAYAFPLPVWVICDLLGVPDSDRNRFSYWSDTMLSLSRYKQDEIDAAMLEFGEFLWAHIEAKRANPGDDLISDLTAVADADDGQLSQLELIGTAQGLLIAGHETTANMIGKMVAMLLAERSRWEELLAEPALVRTAVEEALRFDANPGFGMPRYLTAEIEVAGTTLPAGTTVVNSMAAANRDEKAFENAAEMDLRRVPNAHLSFGAGPHSCIGQALARTELQTALTVLLNRLPELRLAVPVEELPRREGLLIGGLDQVMVRW
ncbi:cytochrome P450 [Actinoplanes sp. GCM10030250]|uniref:cytochrome P450 n=1 Tax=Actinoplanes sp. GCM10030250 TaxID=3273376 RepID=UPI003623A435